MVCKDYASKILALIIYFIGGGRDYRIVAKFQDKGLRFKNLGSWLLDSKISLN